MAAPTMTAVLTGSALVAWCGWASAFPAGTRGGQAVWALSLLGVLVGALLVSRTNRSGLQGSGRADTRLSRSPHVGPRFAGLAPWCALGAIVVVWEVLGIDTGRHEPHLTLSALTLAFRSFRAATLFAWMALGLLFARSRATSSPGDNTDASGRGRRRQGPGAHAFRRRPGPMMAIGTPAIARVAGKALTRQAAAHPAGWGPARTVALLEGGSRSIGVAFWCAVAASAIVLEAAARRSSGRVATFDELVSFVGGKVWLRWSVMAAWGYGGWHLFAH